MIWMMEDGRWWKCCSLQVAPSLSQLGNKTVATSSSSDSAARIAFDVSGPQQSSRRGGDVERRWGGQFSFLLQLKSLPVHLGKKEKLQNQNWQHNLCSPVQILWHLLTSVKEKCYGDKLLYSQCHQNTQLPIWKNNRVCLCFIFWQQSPRTFPWCLIGRRGRSESIARVRLNYQPQEVTGLRYPILPNSSPRRTTFAQK